MPDLLNRLAAFPQPISLIQAGTLDSASSGKGAYVLLMYFAAPVRFLHKRTAQTLNAGWYAYAGSAYGPGGIRARLRRHFRHEKKLHWHVDHLTVIASEIHAVALEGGSECDIAHRLLDSGGFQPAIEHFGSSDCTHCRTHLLRFSVD